MKLTPIWIYLVAGILVGDAMILAVWYLDGYLSYVAAIAIAVLVALAATGTTSVEAAHSGDMIDTGPARSERWRTATTFS